jgi:hypothetical protein
VGIIRLVELDVYGNGAWEKKQKRQKMSDRDKGNTVILKSTKTTTRTRKQSCCKLHSNKAFV